MKNEKANNTPGPWEVCKVENSIGYEIRERDFGPLLANVFGANEKANARLIAAAPELLAALENVVDWMGDVANNRMEKRVIKEARAVISKAAFTRFGDKKIADKMDQELMDLQELGVDIDQVGGENHDKSNN